MSKLPGSIISLDWEGKIKRDWDDTLSELNFFQITKDRGIATICTYKSMEELKKMIDSPFETINQIPYYQVNSLFGNMGEFYNPRDFHYRRHGFDKVLCVELRQTYNSLEELAKDLLTSKLSGILDDENVAIRIFLD